MSLHADRPLSSSYRPSAFEAIQSSQQSATFTDGHRMPEKQRPILSHMAATYSDGTRIPSQQTDAQRLESGTPRMQHGFEV